MSIIQKLSRVVKSIRLMGILPLIYLAIYRLGLWTGIWRVLTPSWENQTVESFPVNEPTSFASPVFSHLVQTTLRNFYNRQPEAATALITEALKIINGSVRLFGGPPRSLLLVPPGEMKHWTYWENGYFLPETDPDIKLIWEPARFGWAFTLSRAYLLTEDDEFAAAFWKYFHLFQQSNPVNLGPNWMSAQEIALRLMAWCFAGRILAPSSASTPENIQALRDGIAAHANRLSLTRVYALAQNNNHLLTESAGLFTAGVFLPEHPLSKKWKNQGWDWVNHALLNQIAPDGVYAQHSTNYHRLMLNTALWVQALGLGQSFHYSDEVMTRLAAATRWLQEQVDPISGSVPNLGSNDGAEILPLSSKEFVDYRPVVQASSQNFLNTPCFQSGDWDELSLWLEVFRQRRIDTVSSAEISEHTTPRIDSQLKSKNHSTINEKKLPPSSNLILRSENSWASIRAQTYHNRPSHADQLHVDLWWRGINIARDAGTFRYNAASSWENSLAGTRVHNTITINNLDQMTRAGKFLWLDWAQAGQVNIKENVPNNITVQHNGYLHLGVNHIRRLFLVKPDTWRIEDSILPTKTHVKPIKVCLHWLLPDFTWQLTHKTLLLTTPVGLCKLVVTVKIHETKSIVEKEHHQLIRAGKTLVGHGPEDLTLGWFSPTYDFKEPALSFRTILEAAAPITLISEWSFSGLE